MKRDPLPWSHNGTQLKEGMSVEEMVIAAGLNWTTEKVPLTGPDGETLPRHFGLRRSDTKAYLDVCGTHYTPTDNKDAMAFFNEFVIAGDAHMSTMGSLGGGRVVWALADLGKSFKLPGNDTVRGYLFLGMPHMKGRSLIARITTLRDVCHNTMQVTMRLGRYGTGDTFRMTHRQAFDEKQKERAKEVLGLARGQFREFEHVARRLTRTKVTVKQTEEMLQRVFQKPSTSEQSPKVKAILEAYHNAPGAQPGTAWGVLNAVTYWSDHVASRSPDKRLTNAWLGRTARQKSQILTMLTAIDA